MAAPPFDINIAIPGDTDLVSGHPANARVFRDITESWLLLLSDVYGRVKVLAGTTATRNGLTAPGTNILFINTDFTPPVLQRYNGATWDNLSAIAASEGVAGIVPIASQAITNTGTSDVTAVSPLKLTNWSPACAAVGVASADSYLIADASDAGKLKLVPVTNAPLVNPSFRATCSAATSLTASTYVKMPAATETFDTNANYDAVTNFRFTPTVAGKYLITVQAATIMTKDQEFRVAIAKNGTVVSYKSVHHAGIAADLLFSLIVTDIVDMNGSTDFVEAFVWCDDTSPSVLNGDVLQNIFSGCRVG